MWKSMWDGDVGDSFMEEKYLIWTLNNGYSLISLREEWGYSKERDDDKVLDEQRGHASD